MELFEGIVKTLLEQEGYWVRQSYKVNLTKQEKRDIGKHSIPRPEIDLLAYKAQTNSIIVLEAKSYFDSPGVKIADLQEHYLIPEGRYKLFTSERYRNIVFSRLKTDLVNEGLINAHTSLQLGLVAGNVYRNKSSDIAEFFSANEWFFWSPDDVKMKVNSLAKMGYENNTAIITAKILMRESAERANNVDCTKALPTNTATRASMWLAVNYPQESVEGIRSSKFYEDNSIWFFTIPYNYLSEDRGHLKLMLAEIDYTSFYFLKIPISYLLENREKLSIRSNGDKFDLHISTKEDNKFKDIRGDGLNFSKFLVC